MNNINYVCNIVSFKNNGSTLSRSFNEFTKEQIENGELDKFISRKTEAGFTCIRANYTEVFTKASIIKNTKLNSTNE